MMLRSIRTLGYGSLESTPGFTRTVPAASAAALDSPRAFGAIQANLTGLKRMLLRWKPKLKNMRSLNCVDHTNKLEA